MMKANAQLKESVLRHALKVFNAINVLRVDLPLLRPLPSLFERHVYTFHLLAYDYRMNYTSKS